MLLRRFLTPVLQLAVAALASGLMLVVMLTLGTVVPRYVMAGETLTGNDATLPSGSIVTNDLYVSGRKVTIDGSALRDVVGVSGEFTLNGLINGNLNLAARRTTINGPIGRSVRVTGQHVTINSTVGGDVVVFAASVTVGPNATISGDLIVYAGDVVVDGNVRGAIKGGANKVTINGLVMGPVSINAGSMNTAETTPAPASQSQAATPFGGAATAVPVAQTQVQTPTPVETTSTSGSSRTSPGQIAAYYRWFQFAAAVVSTIVLILVLPKTTRNIAGSIRSTPFAALVAGILALAIVPLAMLLLTVTIIGIPLAMVVAMLMICAAYLSQVFAGVAIGQLITNRLNWGSGRLPTLAAGVFGVCLIWIVRSLPIPIWNFTVAFVIALAGLGGIVLAIRRSPRTTTAV